MSYVDKGQEPRPLVAPLGKILGVIAPLHWPLIRITCGLILFGHGWPKLMKGASAVAEATLAGRGIEPALPFAYALIFLETVGALMVAAGLFTRVMAAAIAVEFAVLVMLYLPNGFAWSKSGYEYPLLWGLMFVAIALRGGGPYSADRLIGREI